jgi:tetratricopeptide (TPR) repeat protein
MRESAALAEAETVIDFLTDDLLASALPERAKSQQVTVRYIIETASRQIADKFEGKPHVEARIRETLGMAFLRLSDFIGAEPHIKRVWEIRRDQLGEEHPSTLAAMSSLGRIYARSGRVAEAEPLLLEAFEKQTRILGKEHVDTLQSMCDLAHLYVFGGRYKEWQLCVEALEITKRLFGEEHPLTLNAMQSTVWCYFGDRRHEATEPLARKGYEASLRLFGKEHEDTLLFMILLGAAFESQDRLTEAYPITFEAVEICERVLGEEHWVTASAINQLGWICSKQGRFKEAEPLLIKSIELNQHIFEAGHTLTQLYMIKLAWCYRDQQRFNEMDAVLIRALKLDFALSGVIFDALRQRVIQLAAMAQQFYQAGQYNHVLTALAQKKKLHGVLGDQDIEWTAAEMVLIAVSQHQIGNNMEAKMKLQELRSMFDGEGTFRPKEKYLCEAEKCFADSNSDAYQVWDLIEQGSLREAMHTIDALREPGEEISDSDSTALACMRKALARAYIARGMEAVAGEQYEKALADLEAAVAIDPSYAMPSSELGWLLATCPSDVIRDGERALEYATKACEMTNWKIAKYVDTLAAAYGEQGNFGTAFKWQKTAIALLPEEERPRWEPEFEQRLNLYASGKPYYFKKRSPMIARWDFEEATDRTVPDSSGEDHHAKLQGDASIVVDKERGSVLSLQGNGYVDCGAGRAFDITGPLTLSCWIKVKEFTKEWQGLICKGNSAWRINRNGDTGALNLAFTGLEVPSDPLWSAAKGTIEVIDGKWHHIVGVYDGSRMCLYVDSSLDTAVKASGSIRVNNEPVCIGRNSESSDRMWKGLVDDVRVYDYALTPAEIQDLYAGEEPLP